MTKAKGLIISLAAIIMTFSAASCMKEDNTLRYDNMTMGNIVDGVFVSDQGNKFNVIEQTYPGKLDTMKRAFIICDVLRNTSAEEKEFDVRVNYIANVLTKEAVEVSEIEDIETYMNDALILRSIWISGGYINLYLQVPVKRTNGKPHELNMIHEVRDGKHHFQIRHDAKGETLKSDGSNSDLTLAYAYASFPVSSIIKEESAMMTISWNSYMENGQYISAQTKELSLNIEYKKSAFQQVPTTAVASEAAIEIE